MLSYEYYLIKTKPDFAKRLQSYPKSPSEVVEAILGEPYVWQKPKRYPHNLAPLQVKLFHLASIYEDYVPVHDQGVNEIIGDLIGLPPYTEEDFDKWWDIEPILAVEDFAKYETNISLKALRSIDTSSNSFIDDWVTVMMN